MNLAQALKQIEYAGKCIVTTTDAVQRSGKPGQQAVTNLLANLYTVEKVLADFVTRQIARPVPAVDPKRVGSWADEASRTIPNWRAMLESLSVPDHIFSALNKIVASAKDVYDWARDSAGVVADPRQPTKIATAQSPRALTVAQGQKPANPEDLKRKIGLVMMLTSIAASAAAMWSAYQRDQKRKESGESIDPQDPPPEVSGQNVLDTEVPGARLHVAKGPDRSYVASVRKGRDVLSRKKSKRADEAASSAVNDAIDRSAEVDVIDAEVIGGKGMEAEVKASVKPVRKPASEATIEAPAAI